ncbi:Sorting nexin-13 [Eumeta japonica]|uniref:Sorting nexin-13 n=1 Tax=Eumeta variegata TaxID=151549 RepID=A0A4C1UDG3_EUMVA|nr:Sorting nexin-13 [Eumeta japonica]
MDDEEPAIEPLVDISGVSFSDFVQVDEDVAVSGSLTDGEILSATDMNEKSNDKGEDDISEPLAEVVKSVDWIHLLSSKFPEELTTHLKLFKQSRVRLKQINCGYGKDVNNGNSRCCRDSTLPSDLFLMVIRCSEDFEELDAILELVQKEIQKLHSKDSVGECELPVRQQLSSLQYLTRIINTRRAAFGPQEGASNDSNTVKMSEDVKRSLEFINASNAWRSNAQYLLEIEINESDSLQTSKVVIDNLRSSALELCDMYLAPNKQTVFGLPDNCYTDLVRKITTEDDEFTNNPISCFDDVQKCVFDALEDIQIWQSDYLDTEDLTERNSGTKKDKFDSRKYTGDVLTVPNLSTRHNRSRSDIVGNSMQKIAYETSAEANRLLIEAYNEAALSKRTCREWFRKFKNGDFDLKDKVRSGRPKIYEDAELEEDSSQTQKELALTLEVTQQAVSHHLNSLGMIDKQALVQDKGKTFGIYAIAVTRLADNEIWHIYRRYSDFYDLHTSVKDKWPELSHLEFPAKKTFQNTSRVVLERRKKVLNRYLQSLMALTRESRYAALLSENYLGGFLSPENQAERHSSSIDALLVNSLRAGMRTLKNMPDQFATTVDGVMDGISKVFQGKSENYPEDFHANWSSDAHLEGDESVALRLLEEVLGIRGLWLRRRLLAPLRTVIADRVNRKVLEFVSSLTSPRNVVHYLKSVKQWLSNRSNLNIISRDLGTKARTRVAAKVALLASCSDDLRHIVGSDTARRGLLTVFDLFQSQEINRRLLFVLLEDEAVSGSRLVKFSDGEHVHRADEKGTELVVDGSLLLNYANANLSIKGSNDRTSVLNYLRPFPRGLGWVQGSFHPHDGSAGRCAAESASHIIFKSVV